MSTKCWKVYIFLLSVIYIHNVLCDGETLKMVNITSCSKPCKIEDDRVLTCEHCNCTTIPDMTDISLDVRYLQEVFFGYNYIVNITKLGNFQWAHLDLSKNAITNIEDNAFRDLPNLRRLILSKNMIKIVKEEHFAELTNLEELDLSWNYLERVESNVFYRHLSELKTLRLNGNLITDIDHNAFTDLKKLQYLRLENNLITTIHANHFLGLDNLEELLLRNNMIFKIPNKCFYECGNMKTLDMRSNWINNISTGAFFRLNKLNILYLSNNNVPNITKGAMFGLDSLQSLYLDNNPIASIQPGSLPKSLTKFSLSNSHMITTIANKTFTDLKELSTVRIRNNTKLKLIEVGAFQDETTVGRSTVVKDLNLYNNSLMTLSQDLLNWTLVEEPVLGKNDWVCDCNMAWVTMNNVFNKDVKEQIVCSHPHYLRGKPVTEVDFKQFSCSFFAEHQYQLEIALIIFVTILFVMVGGFLLYHWRHSLFPCCYIMPGKYSTMYNAVNTDEEEKVKIKVGSKLANETGYQTSKQEKVVPGPTSV